MYYVYTFFGTPYVCVCVCVCVYIYIHIYTRAFLITKILLLICHGNFLKLCRMHFKLYPSKV